MEWNRNRPLGLILDEEEEEDRISQLFNIQISHDNFFC
jgi:hypothetical protein